MQVKEKLEEFFSIYQKKITFGALVKKIGVDEIEIGLISQYLFELEKEGKIYCDEYGYFMHVPKEFYLGCGTVKISNKGNFYVETEKKERINIQNKNLKEAKVGDTVFFTKCDTKNNNLHKNYQVGIVDKVIKKFEINNNRIYKQKAILQRNRNGCYYIILNDKIIPVISTELKSAYPGDTVSVEIEEAKNSKRAKVVGVIKRKQKDHLFQCQKNGEEITWIPIGIPYFSIELKENTTKYQVGDIVSGTLLNEQNNRKNFVLTNSKKILLSSNMDRMELLAREHGFKIEFSEKTEQEILEIKNPKLNRFENRINLKNLTTFTIDPSTAKDLDDAISLEYSNGIYRLYVHIADVSYYIPPNSELFDEAYSRGNSVYPANCVFPMLPKELSDDLCSLNQNEEKLTKTVIIDINKEGKILNFSIVNSFIKSDCKMSYEKVNALLVGDGSDISYLCYYNELKNMKELSDILQKRRMERGFLFFDNDEMQFDLDEKGSPTMLRYRSKGQAQLMIENFMLLANEVVSNYAYWLNIPFVYRNHESPSVLKIKNLEEDLKKCGVYNRLLNNVDNPKNFQRILISLFRTKSKEEIACLSNILLKQMNRAYYQDSNKGHYGLALEQYGTFTSPIRKFSDLLNHYFINEVIDSSTDTQLLKNVKENLNDICIHLSERQYEADQCEQEVNNFLLLEYAQKFLGQTMKATISLLMDDCMFIHAENNIFGIINYKGKFQFYKNKCVILEKREKEFLRVGDSINVGLEDISLNRSEIKFNYISKNQNINKIEREDEYDKYKRKRKVK